MRGPQEKCTKDSDDFIISTSPPQWQNVANCKFIHLIVSLKMRSPLRCSSFFWTKNNSALHLEPLMCSSGLVASRFTRLAHSKLRSYPRPIVGQQGQWRFANWKTWAFWHFWKSFGTCLFTFRCFWVDMFFGDDRSKTCVLQLMLLGRKNHVLV